MVNQILSYLPNIDKEDLAELMHIIDQSRLFHNHIKTNLPDNEFELGYANYLGTNSNKFVDVTYYNVVADACFKEFLEWYEYLMKNILRSDVQQALGLNFDASASNWEEEVKKSELFGWAFRVTSTEVYMDNIQKVKVLGDIMVNFFNARKPLSVLDDDYFESDHAQLVLDSVDKILIQKDRQELINQLQSEKVLCMVEVYGWENRFNPVLLNWIYNNKERVKQWT